MAQKAVANARPSGYVVRRQTTSDSIQITKSAKEVLMDSITVQTATRFEGCIQVPGDKSISHRVLMLSAAATGRSKLSGVCTGTDVLNTAQAMASMGAKITRQADSFEVEATGLHESQSTLNVGNAGTGIRLMLGLVSGYDFLTIIEGDASIAKRPMLRVVDPLRQMGSRIDGREGGNYAPLVVRGGNLAGGTYHPAVASAQVKGALLLAGLGASAPTTVVEQRTTRPHTEELLVHFGGQVRCHDNKVTVYPSKLSGADISVPGDPSQAAFWICGAAAMPGAEVTVKDIYLCTERIGFLEILRRMGARVEILQEHGSDRGSVKVIGGSLGAVEVHHSEIPSIIDEIPILAIAAALANGTSIFRGVSELRFKESDRVATIRHMLTAFGVRSRMNHDDLYIDGKGQLTSGTVDSFGDHRIAMAAAIAASLATDTSSQINGWSCVETSYPGFIDTLHSITR